MGHPRDSVYMQAVGCRSQKPSLQGNMNVGAVTYVWHMEPWACMRANRMGLTGVCGEKEQAPATL